MRRGSATPSRTWLSTVFLVLITLACTAAASAQTPAVTTLLPNVTTVPPEESTQQAPPPLPQSSPTPQASPTPPVPKASPTPSLERRFFRNLLRDQRAIWTSPLRVRGDDARWLAPLGVSTAALIATDRRTAGVVEDDSDRFNESAAVSSFGSFYTLGGVAVAFYIVGRGTGNARARETGLLSLQALANGTIVSGVLKRVTQRPRPLQESGHGRFFDEGNSFPSGHAVNVWSVATVVAEEYRDRPLVRYGAYGLATAVSLSRYTGRRHFLSDVLAGSAIGYGIGRYVYRKHHDPNLGSPGDRDTLHERSKLLPSILPSYDHRTRGYGLGLTWSF